MRFRSILTVLALAGLVGSAAAFPFTSAWNYTKPFRSMTMTSKAFGWFGLEGPLAEGASIKLTPLNTFYGHVGGVPVTGKWKALGKPGPKGRARLVFDKASTSALAVRFAQDQSDVLSFVGFPASATSLKCARARATMEYTPGQSAALSMKLRFYGSVTVFWPGGPENGLTKKCRIKAYLWDVSDDAIEGNEGS